MSPRYGQLVQVRHFKAACAYREGVGGLVPRRRVLWHFKVATHEWYRGTLGGLAPRGGLEVCWRTEGQTCCTGREDGSWRWPGTRQVEGDEDG